ncbi:CrcB family protein [Microbacterium deminutum]|uniref:Fluoride-specific ion channel FluC n=1 Tax=Microbacterium deminutum TaxID=344164 RepID=A0ABP5BYW6_9MICO
MTTAPGPVGGAPDRGARLAILGLVVAGGAVGVLARAALLLPVTDPAAIPWVTAVINAAGSFLLGVVVGWLDGRHPRARAFVGTGVLGGFTTYSAFAVQTVAVGGDAPGIAVGLVVASVGAGFLGAIIGLFVGRRIADVPGEIEPPESAE